LSGCDVDDHDTKSAIQFISPGIWKVASGDASPASIRSAKALSRCAAIGAFVANRHDDHATVGVLSHPIATWVWAISAMTSSTSHWHSISAISKSKFVSQPVGLDSDTIACWMSSGKVILHTIGGSGLLSQTILLWLPSLMHHNIYHSLGLLVPRLCTVLDMPLLFSIKHANLLMLGS